MSLVCFVASVLLLIVGHLFRLLRWEQFIKIYERPSHGYLITAMAGGYAVNFFLPFHLGDVFRASFCGHKMRSGTGFGFSTVIMDRFLDVWFVALFFVGFRYFGLTDNRESETYYLLFGIVLVVLMLLLLVLRDPLKRVCLSVSGVFNDSIKLDVMTFLWSLICTFKDLLRVKKLHLLINTLFMWAAYLASYASIAKCLTLNGCDRKVYDIFQLLFGAKKITQTTISAITELNDRKAVFILLIWLIVPILMMFLITLLPKSVKNSISSVTGIDRINNYENLLPQLDPGDRALFLSRYFGLENKEYLSKFLDINRGISIIQDYSAGSNATTMLCVDKSGTFFRKYAFGTDGEKLSEQLKWLKEQKNKIPLCTILRDKEDTHCCWYDMAYDPTSVDFFRYIHSHPVQDSMTILCEILDRLRSSLYIDLELTESEREERIKQYIGLKVRNNLDRIENSKLLKELYAYDTLIINGIEYRNLSQISFLHDSDFLTDVFRSDPMTNIHGDLTVENVICRADSRKDWYLIDPNPGNIHDSPYLDYAKLLQSFHGSYEFMMMTPSCHVTDNRIDFQLTRSAAYDSILDFLKSYIRKEYGKDGYRSIFIHETVHWLRLLPYKLSKDKKRAPMFYAGLVMVANDVRKEIENEE